MEGLVNETEEEHIMTFFVFVSSFLHSLSIHTQLTHKEFSSLYPLVKVIQLDSPHSFVSVLYLFRFTNFYHFSSTGLYNQVLYNEILLRFQEEKLGNGNSDGDRGIK